MRIMGGPKVMAPNEMRKSPASFKGKPTVGMRPMPFTGLRDVGGGKSLGARRNTTVISSTRETKRPFAMRSM